MAFYDVEQGFQSILDAALGEELAREFRLESVVNGHVLMLYHKDKLVEAFTEKTALIGVIRATCREHLEGIRV